MAAQGIVQLSMNKFEDFKSYLKLAFSCIRRHRPLKATMDGISNALKNILTANKKVKIAKYRVNHLRYRLYQMEKLMETNNPNSYISGKSLNIYR